jgi:uncharacterized delta-60 repeat protein
MYLRRLAGIALMLLPAFFLSYHARATVAQPGTLDQTWGLLGDGKVTTPVGISSDFGRAMVVQPDGKALVAGECTVDVNNQFCVVRYNTDGTLDMAWNGTGKVFSALGGDSASATAIALQSDGRALVAGICVSATLGRQVFCVARFNTDGSLDTTWNGVGYVVTSIGTLSDSASAIIALDDGRVIVAGSCAMGSGRSDVCLVRYGNDGAPDMSWGNSGKVLTRVPGDGGIINSAVVQSDGSVLVAGYCREISVNLCVLRYGTTGVPDNAWGVQGIVVLSIANNESAANTIFLQQDGRAIVAGVCYNGTVNGSCAARLNSNGSLDTSWNGTGYVIRQAPGGESFNAIARQPDGKLIFAGGCTNGFANAFCATRFFPDGTIDLSWGNNGKATTTFSGGDGATGIAIGTDGRVLLAGYCNNGRNANFCALRYDGGLTATHGCSLDIDGDGALLATKDALLLTRAMLGGVDSAVVGNIEFSTSAVRQSWPDIRNYLATNAPDLDGDGRVMPATDALILARIALGFAGDAVVDDIDFPANAQRKTWTEIQWYLFSQCRASDYLTR